MRNDKVQTKARKSGHGGTPKLAVALAFFCVLCGSAIVGAYAEEDCVKITLQGETESLGTLCLPLGQSISLEASCNCDEEHTLEWTSIPPGLTSGGSGALITLTGTVTQADTHPVAAACTGHGDAAATLIVFKVTITDPAGSAPVYKPLSASMGLSSSVSPTAAAGGTYSWSVAEGPTGAQYQWTSAGTSTPTFRGDTPGDYALRVEYTKDSAMSYDETGYIWFVGVSAIKINPSGSTWTQVDGGTDEVILKGTKYTFWAIRDPANAPAWPSGQPQWDSSYWGMNRTDNGDQTAVTFTGEYDDRFLKATCGTSEKTATMDVIVPTVCRLDMSGTNTNGHNMQNAEEYWTASGGDKVGCFTQGAKTKVAVQFKHASQKALSFETDVEIYADVDSTDHGITGGDYEATAVTFGTGTTTWGTHSAESENNAEAQVDYDTDVDMQWKYRVPTGTNSWECVGNVEDLTYYLVWSTPSAPQATPWHSVIQTAVTWADDKGSAAAALDEITLKTYSQLGKNYNSSSTNSSGTSCNLTALLAATTVDCRDVSAYVHILSRAIGIATEVRQIAGRFYYKPIDPIGSPGWTTGGYWDYHQVTHFGNVYDACERLNQSSPRIARNEAVNGTYKTDLFSSGYWTPGTPFSYTSVY